MRNFFKYLHGAKNLHRRFVKVEISSKVGIITWHAYYHNIEYGVMVSMAAFHENDQGSKPCLGEQPAWFFILNL